ncbi:hypothetical protein GCM10009718_10400 [Isoptericola halotolerans]|uniref:Uncharacterized protein n=1 Tax=Isoptericola halotolerans TaxID=300560 RepID=A0ABX1ZZL5_9MICO|nr:hypothetical protein [Isoptericola halotolerans]NOV96038.1 hypothetical protein [Isoptericola halotolerans]
MTSGDDIAADLRQFAELARSSRAWSVDVDEPTSAWRTVRVTVSRGDGFVTLFEDNEQVCWMSSAVPHSTPARSREPGELIGLVEELWDGA